MSTEHKIAKELAALNSCAAQWLSFTRIVNSTFREGEFLSLFNKMAKQLPGSFRVVVDTINPLTDIASLHSFSESFDQLQADYQKNFLQAASKPRFFTESTHELYLELVAFKEIKTRYPILKRNFENLYEFMDKWVTNDTWLVMSCDVVFKSMNRFLLEIKDFKQQDIDEAWLLYQVALFSPAQSLQSLSKTLTAIEMSISRA